MPDFLTRRDGMWHVVRRVPIELAAFDPRGIVRHSTRIRVASDRTGRRTVRVAEQRDAALHFGRARNARPRRFCATLDDIRAVEGIVATQTSLLLTTVRF